MKLWFVAKYLNRCMIEASNEKSVIKLNNSGLFSLKTKRSVLEGFNVLSSQGIEVSSFDLLRERTLGLSSFY